MNKALIQRFDYTGGKSFNFGLFSDLHLDAHGHNRPKLLRDLKDCADNDGRAYIDGDIFDFILPGDRKRYTRGNDLHDTDDQLGQIIQEGVEVLKPFVDMIDMIGLGNHETSVLKYHHLDPVRLLIWELDKLRSPSLPKIHHGGYTGFIRHFYSMGTGRGRSYTIWYHHGKGGSSPVTKGMIDLNRVQVMADADLYWMGHKHTSITDDGIKQVYCDKEGNVKVREKIATFTGGYKTALITDRDYMKTGYGLDYSEEQHLGLQSDGYKLLTINPSDSTGNLKARITKR